MLDIERIKRDYAYALRSRCSESGCTLRLDRLSNRVVLKGDDICQDRKMCDCIIFITNGSATIAIVELKSKTAHTSEILDKLTNSSEIALDILEKYANRHMKPILLHILLHKGLDGSERRKMERSRIRVKGEKHDIIRKPCGTSLYKIISEFGK